MTYSNPYSIPSTTTNFIPFSGMGMRKNGRAMLLPSNYQGDGSTLDLDFTTGVLDPRLTFSRAGGGTYVGSDGYIYGVDSATSASLAIGTGSKSVTLTATAGVDRRFQVGQTVYFSSGANNMSGLVTAYNASTQVITINATATTGSGSFTSWFVGNASPRFDYSPTNIGEPRGLLVEGQAVNYVRFSDAPGTSGAGGWSPGGTPTITFGGGAISPDGITTSTRIQFPPIAGATISRIYQETGYPLAAYPYTMSVWMKSNTAGNHNVNILGSANTNNVVTPAWQRFVVTVTSSAGLYRYFYISNESSTLTTDISIWGAQLEAGSGASSYIPTGASQVTRNADYCQSTVASGIANWLTSLTTSTYFVDFVPMTQRGGFANTWNTRTSTFQGYEIYCFDGTAGVNLTCTTKISASTNVETNVATGLALNSRHKIAYSISAGSGLRSVNGSTVSAANPVALPTGTPSTFGVGSGGGGSGTSINAWIRSVKYYPTALTQTEINGMTAA